MGEKLYYRLEEVAKEFDCHIDDIFYRARHEGLKLSLLIRNTPVAVHKKTKWEGELGELKSTGIVADSVFDLPGRAMIDIEEQGFCQHVVILDEPEEEYYLDGDGEHHVIPGTPVLLYFGEHKFKLNSVIITRENLPKPEHSTTDEIPSYAFPDKCKWEDVHIRFTDFTKAEITIGHNAKVGDYKTFGFINQTDGSPLLLWNVLYIMAIHEGNPPQNTRINSEKKLSKNHVSDLQRKLQELFPNIEGNPFKTYRRGHGWVPNLQLTPYEYLESPRC